MQELTNGEKDLILLGMICCSIIATQQTLNTKHSKADRKKSRIRYVYHISHLYKLIYMCSYKMFVAHRVGNVLNKILIHTRASILSIATFAVTRSSTWPTSTKKS